MIVLIVSFNRRYVVIVEKGEKFVIIIYDFYSLRKRKVLSFLEFVKFNEYVSLVFLLDFKYLVVQSGKSDYIFFYWIWEKSKVMVVQKIFNLNINVLVY